MIAYLTTPPADWPLGTLPPGAALLALVFPLVAWWARGALR